MHSLRRVYDEEKGDPDSGIAPGTKFEDLTDNWCPKVPWSFKIRFQRPNNTEV